MDNLVRNQAGITTETLKQFEQFLLLKKDNPLANDIRQALLPAATGGSDSRDSFTASAPVYIPTATPVVATPLGPPPAYH